VDDLTGRGGPAPPATIYGGALGELDQIDQAVYRAIAATPSPSLDVALSRLSSAADHFKMWLAMAAALALTPGRPRRAALLGVASIGVASATVNLVGKGLLRRARPDRAGLGVAAGRRVKMPGSTSFPSGHSASAFAFATAVGDELPLAWLPLHGVAAAVTYSRVHTGVHYPGDVLVGSLMGTGAAVAVRYTTRALTHRKASPAQPGSPTMSGSAGTVLSANAKRDRGGGWEVGGWWRRAGGSRI
jgi:membrane-associated phospholipid phosphatase